MKNVLTTLVVPLEFTAVAAAAVDVEIHKKNFLVWE